MRKAIVASLLALAAAAVANTANADMVVQSIEMTRSGDRMIFGTTRTLWIGNERYRLTYFGKGSLMGELFIGYTRFLLHMEDKTYSNLNRQAAWEKQKVSNEAPLAVDRQIMNTHRSEKAAGWVCEVWQVFEKKELQQELCVVPLVNLPDRSLVLLTMRAYNQWVERQGSHRGHLPWADVETTAGFPIITRNFANGKLDNSSTATGIGPAQSPPDSVYRLPEGWDERKD